MAERPGHNYLRRTHADKFGDGVTKFDATVTVDVGEDTHIVVATCGEGRRLGAVYGEDAGKMMPMAVSNPVYVDLAGDGFQPNGDDLGIPLPVESDHEPTHGHDHPHGHSHEHESP